ncbi:carbohydrate ABC transporter permease [Actinobaculum suis]|uniref:carbohydrate ABC transporter permease n=1 Tax=Actinobaculum suis TaxID=1657 RepID=UPI0008087131|nr:sugar ABC transporter permease [Actinobaculum suis]OCA95132.1 ABC transporter permease [Actinobaculum suis]OCA95598.1 ABC transporter permease [Actinobaculum suis]
MKTLKKHGLAFAGPTLVAFGIAFLVPFVVGIFLSLTEFTTIQDATWVGMKNYAQVFAEEQGYSRALLFTTLVAVVAVISVNLIAFFLAYILSRKIPGQNLFRTVFFLPNLIGGIVLGYTWQALLNAVLSRWGETIVNDWKYGFLGLVLVVNWQMIGYMMIIYIAGFQNVPQDLLEAAQLDGAGRWRTLRSVTIPMMMPSITICLFLTLTNAFKIYDQNLALTNGEPLKMTEMSALNIVTSMYDQVGQEGIAQAKAVIFFLIVSALSLIQLRATRAKEIDQ